MIAVVGDHLITRPAGGFAGVDVFFVISGYLITGLLWREYERTGRISLRTFYTRRIKRTVPVAIVVAAVTLVVGAILLPIYRFQQLVQATIAASTFWINWQLIGQGTDYLHATDLPTAVQHYWSLAVEEQFYLVWPAILIGVLFLATRLKFSRRASALTVMTLIAVVSIGWCAWESATQPTAAYFSTAARGWELGAGAILALASPLTRFIPLSVQTPLSWAGAAAIAVSLFAITPDSPFPFPTAILPVVGTLLVIAAGERGLVKDIYPLTNPASTYIGKISYSLYLWHYPVVIFAASNLTPSLAVHVLELGLMVALSVLSFHWVEEPLRQKKWFRPIQTRTRSRRPSLRLVLTGALIVALSATLTSIHQPSTAEAVPLNGAFDASSVTTPAQAERQREVKAALRATAWPAQVKTQILDQNGLFAPEWVVDNCLWLRGSAESFAALSSRCVFGDKDASKTVVVYGDSIAISYVPALRAALAHDDYRIVVMAAEQCPALTLSVMTVDQSPYPECDRFHTWAQSRIAAMKPFAVVMASSYSAIWRQTDAGDQQNALFESAAAATVARLAKSTSHVMVLDAPPSGRALRDCLTLFAAPANCASSVDPNYLRAETAQRAGAATTSGVIYPSTLAWYCDAQGRCPAFVGSDIALSDGEHPSYPDAMSVGKVIKSIWTQMVDGR